MSEKVNVSLQAQLNVDDMTIVMINSQLTKVEQQLAPVKKENSALTKIINSKAEELILNVIFKLLQFLLPQKESILNSFYRKHPLLDTFFEYKKTDSMSISFVVQHHKDHLTYLFNRNAYGRSFDINTEDNAENREKLRKQIHDEIIYNPDIPIEFVFSEKLSVFIDTPNTYRTDDRMFLKKSIFLDFFNSEGELLHSLKEDLEKRKKLVKVINDLNAKRNKINSEEHHKKIKSNVLATLIKNNPDIAKQFSSMLAVNQLQEYSQEEKLLNVDEENDDYLEID